VKWLEVWALSSSPNIIKRRKYLGIYLIKEVKISENCTTLNKQTEERRRREKMFMYKKK
jgi:hypothetical protein